MENSKKAKKIYSYRLREENAEWLRAKAEEDRRTASNYLDLLIERLREEELSAQSADNFRKKDPVFYCSADERKP